MMETVFKTLSSTCETICDKSAKENNIYTNKMISPLQNNENCDENGNSGSFKLFTTAISDNTLSLETEDHYTPVDRVNKCFKQLRIESRTDESELNEGQCLAGNINNVITALNTILVKPLSSDVLLYFGTPLFLKYTTFRNCHESNYVLLGYIDDIFGSIGEPMYCVNIMHNSTIELNVGKDVYYFLNNPNTRFMNVEPTEGDAFNEVKYNIRTRNL